MLRKEKIKAFLDNAGWEGAKISALAGDASFRRYDRIELNGKKAVLMDAPPEFEDTRPFVSIAEFLIRSGLRAPEIFAKDFKNGFLLIEDLGDDLFKTVLEQEPDREQELYKSAVDELVGLNKQSVPKVLPYGDGGHILPTYDTKLLLEEVKLLSDWYYPALFGKRLSLDKRIEFLNIWRDVLAKLGEPDECLVLRDYHAENLLDLGNGQVGQLDFQDAVIGHSSYDLVSLLQDARRDVSPEIEEDLIVYFADALERDLASFKEQYAILGAQRNIKIIGIFARLSLRDGKDIYLNLQPRVWGLLERCLEHPSLAQVKEWLDREIPNKRDIPLDPKPLYPSHSMILAAGLGTRMKPLTNDILKPLIKVAGKEMLGHGLDALAAAGIKNAVINKHHFPEQIENFIDSRSDWRPTIFQSDECAELLDSGGGVKNALPLLGSEPFLILNSDMIWTDNDQDTLSRLASHWHDDMDILMLLVRRDLAHGHDGPGDFHMDDNGRLTFRGDDPESDYMYGGILIMRPECFAGIEDEVFSLRKIFRRTAKNKRLFGLLHQGAWYHVGTPDAIGKTEQLLKGT